VAGGEEFRCEFDRRRAAIDLVDEGIPIAEVARRVDRSRWSVYEWLRRHAAEGDEGLKDRPRVPKTQPTKTPEEVIDKILETRRRLDKDPVANIGALTILAELEREAFDPIPSLRTIERILQRAGVTRPKAIRERSGTKLPLPQVTEPGIWQQADWIQDRWLSGGIRFNSLQIADVGSHGVAAGQYTNRAMINAVTLLVETAWPALSIPDAMGIDNAFTSTTHPNNPFTNWVRACLYFGVETLISPPGVVGWTNHIEAINNEWQRKTIWTERYDTIDALRAGSNRAIAWLNTRRPILDPTTCGTRYPADYIAAHHQQLRWPPTISITDHLDTKGHLRIPLAAGRVTFLRHINEHHTIRLTHTDWPVPDTIPIGGLVTATITTADQQLTIRHQGEPISQFAYPIDHPVIDPYYPPADHSLLHHI
jgi:transposase